MVSAPARGGQPDPLRRRRGARRHRYRGRSQSRRFRRIPGARRRLHPHLACRAGPRSPVRRERRKLRRRPGLRQPRPERRLHYRALPMFNQSHWAAELQHRHPDLVIVNYGTNEADFPAFIDEQYEKELREAIRRLRAALPETSLLIMSPMDRGYKTGGEIATMPTIPRIVELQRRVARETGCGFFDTYQAMGGEG